MIRSEEDSGAIGTRSRGRRAGPTETENGPLILVGVPPTGPVDHLLELSAGMSGAAGTRVLLATVVPLPRSTASAAADSLLEARSRRLARIRERRADPRSTSHVVVVAHGVASGLAEVARQRDADLLVVGWPGNRSKGSAGSWLGARGPIAELVTRAPCNVCVAQRLPANPPDEVLVSADNGPDVALGISVARALISRTRLRKSGLRQPPIRSRESHRVREEGPSSAPEPAQGERSALDRIRVLDPRPDSSGRQVADRAARLGADVLVAGALRERGVWPLRRRLLRTDLVDSFPGPVALVRARSGADDGDLREGGWS